ncbi:hypothetical protein BpHYR1_037293 [Brachionus plicatilis]|uniref:MATH domain-containing protein n=1 Tax=Brachionus plicatilis TaxID=10195 RepID=A0A3M7RYG9_BRAPC|nr:hypothetical protein BpHYR1_037293 [Brachionus plicatilis]
MYKDDINDDIITSEAIWTFDNVDQELLRMYPNGKYLSEEIQTIGGQVWRVDFYPNGKDLKSFGQIILCVSLIRSKDHECAPVNAECSFSFKNIKRRKHYFGKIPLTTFEDNHTEENSTLDNSILKECGTSYPINVTITIYQYPEEYEFPTEQLLETPKLSTNSNSLNKIDSVSSATPTYNFIPADQFDDDDFKKVKVNYLYNKNVLF